MTGPPDQPEQYKVDGDEVLRKIKDLIHEGNVRRIIIKQEDGRKLIEIPMTIGVVGALLLPVWAAIGAIAAVVTDCTIVVERADNVA
ncbi:MAG: DUF4342 domain-containing protein [bacterium]|nr:DUF4342 domain-containing protein [bacterium]